MQKPEDSWLARTRAQSIGSGVVHIDGASYEYDVLPASFLPAVPYFVLFPFGERLFISEQVQERYRTGFCSCEVRSHRLKNSGTEDHFKQAVEMELEFVAPEDVVDYLTMRMHSFQSLLGSIAHMLAPAYTAQVTACRDLFRSKLETLTSITQH